MTVYGGEATTWGARSKGFFVSCTKCGWHSKVEVIPTIVLESPAVIFVCNHCGNEHTEE
jgi:predicted RNA-binding Zn-ribbon protein involved in translation (DUF1610 family)